jgi:hypothetical protein
LHAKFTSYFLSVLLWLSSVNFSVCQTDGRGNKVESAMHITSVMQFLQILKMSSMRDVPDFYLILLEVRLIPFWLVRWCGSPLFVTSVWVRGFYSIPVIQCIIFWAKLHHEVFVWFPGLICNVFVLFICFRLKNHKLFDGSLSMIATIYTLFNIILELCRIHDETYPTIIYR